MKSIYCDKNWAILQQQKDGGYADRFQYIGKDYSVEYTFIVRKAGMVDGIQYYDILTPRGMGGPRCIYGNIIDLEEYNKQFLTYCRVNHIIAEYVRFDPWNDDYKLFGILYDEMEHHGDLFCNNLCRNFLKEEYDNNVKRNIKKNINNVKIQFDFEGKDINIIKFLELYKYTEEKYAVSNYYKLSKEFIQDYFIKLEGKVAIANAIYKDETVSSSIILFGEDIAHYHFACNHPEFRKINANTVLLYKAALLAQEKGKSLFDLGGGIIKGNTAEYKSRFVHKEGIYPYYVGKRIIDSTIYRRLIEVNGRNSEGYFPEYKSN